MNLVKETAKKLGCSEHDVFRLAAEKWPTPAPLEDAWRVWFHEEHLCGWVANFCFDTLGLPPEKRGSVHYRMPPNHSGVR